MKSAYAVTAALVALALPAAAAGPPLDAATLLADAQVVAGYKAKDAFDAPPRYEAFQGRSVRITGPIVDINTPGDTAMGSWSYNAETGRLYVSVTRRDLHMSDFDAEFTTGIPTESLSGIMLGAARKRVGTYLGANVFGVTVRVQEYEELKVLVAEYVPDDLLRHKAGYDRGWAYGVALQLNPGAARALTAHLVAVVEGTVETRSGRGIVCSSEYEEPTINRPEAAQVQTCIVPTRINRVAVENSETGEVLAEWSSP